MTQFILSLIISLIVLVFLILKLKVHPILSLFVAALILGIGSGATILDTIGLINNGFGSTLGNIGIPLILGAILAIGIIDLKAADTIAKFFDKLFKGKRMELAPSLSAFIISIPVFGDITNLLVAPIASRIAQAKKISMTTMVAFTGLGLILTHALVPPTPGILATALALEADLGFVIIYGIIVSLIAFFITWILFRKWTEKEFVPPLPKFAGVVNDDGGKKIGRGIPYSLAFLPILIPIIFIASSSIVNVFLAEGTILHNVMNVLGDRVVALGSGVIITCLIAFMYKQTVFASAMGEDNSISKDTPFLQVIMGSWVARGVAVAILPLLVTAMSGAIAGIISQNENVEVIANNIASSNIPYILVPYILAAILVATVGSITTAALTTAGILAPVLTVLGLSPEAATLAIGAGSLAFIHMNNSGFWIQVHLFNVTTKQGLKYITIPTFVASVVAITALAIFNGIGLI
ncbi:GntP family permease [Siminovitchia acidinfaciens]|nr:gluconate transporter [Siminovitchia acidinfaciens]